MTKNELKQYIAFVQKNQHEIAASLQPASDNPTVRTLCSNALAIAEFCDALQDAISGKKAVLNIYAGINQQTCDTSDLHNQTTKG